MRVCMWCVRVYAHFSVWFLTIADWITNCQQLRSIVRNNDDQIAGKKGQHTGMIRHDDAEENNSFPVFFMVRSSRLKRWY